MKTIRLIFGDQLSSSISALDGAESGADAVLMMEVAEECRHVHHHKQKIVLLLSAMRHFANRLQSQGFSVDYVRLDDENNTGTFTGELTRALARHQASRIILTEPGEWRVMEMVRGWTRNLAVSIEIRDDTRFLCRRQEFTEWAKGRKNLRMEFFYRDMRRKTGWLMAGKTPEGGQWNFDARNRKSLPYGKSAPNRPRFDADATTRDVKKLVGLRFSDHFGDLDSFSWGVTREHALIALDFFIQQCLPQFGDYQDAMKSGETWLFHAALSPYLNMGLLLPKEVCESALASYQSGLAPLPAVEGFIRQILGWREFIRGIYWLSMPAYANSNFFNAQRPLPQFYWTGQSELFCLRQTISAIRENAYAHHIQRLMVTGNFALLAGIAPGQVEDWYLVVFADAFEWVELPNTHGMALYADGGYLASKPYAASAAYIHRMSDYCRKCAFDHTLRIGNNACPFNYLYWNFVIAHESRLKGNPRMAITYRTLYGMSESHRRIIVQQAGNFLNSLQ